MDDDRTARLPTESRLLPSPRCRPDRLGDRSEVFRADQRKEGRRGRDEGRSRRLLQLLQLEERWSSRSASLGSGVDWRRTAGGVASVSVTCPSLADEMREARQEREEEEEEEEQAERRVNRA